MGEGGERRCVGRRRGGFREKGCVWGRGVEIGAERQRD